MVAQDFIVGELAHGPLTTRDLADRLAAGDVRYAVGYSLLQDVYSACRRAERAGRIRCIGFRGRAAVWEAIA